MAYPTINRESSPPRESWGRAGSDWSCGDRDRPSRRAGSAERIEAYDWVRFFAAVNIILFHVVAPTGSLLGRGGTPAFLMIAGSLPAMRDDLGTFRSFARRRARRILVPWLCWSAFYAAIAGVRYLRHGSVPQWTVHYIFVGTSIHLWFFPAVFVATLIAWIVLRAADAWNTVHAAIGVAALGAMLLSLNAFTLSGANLAAPYGQWLFSAPALLIGIGLGLAWKARRRRPGTILIVAIGLIVVAAATVNFAYGQARDGWSYTVAGLAVPAALLLPLRSGRFLRSFSEVSLGVYALHPFVYLVLRSVVAEESLPIGISVALVGVGAVLLSKLMSRVSFARGLV